MAQRKKDQTTEKQENQDQDQATQEEQTGQEDKSGKERDEFASLPNPCVYCGPSVRGVARQYTTYQGGIPDELKKFIRVHPAVRGLIVSTGQFASVRKRLETPGTAEAIIYKKVKDEL